MPRCRRGRRRDFSAVAVDVVATDQPPIDVNPFAPGRGPYSRAAVGSIRRPDPTKINTLTRARAHAPDTYGRARARSSRKRRTVFWFGPFFFSLLIFLRYLYSTAAAAAAAEEYIYACLAHAPSRPPRSPGRPCVRGANRFQRSRRRLRPARPILRAGSKIVCARARSRACVCVSVSQCPRLCVCVCDNDRPTDRHTLFYSCSTRAMRPISFAAV